MNIYRQTNTMTDNRWISISANTKISKYDNEHTIIIITIMNNHIFVNFKSSKILFSLIKNTQRKYDNKIF